MCYPHGAHDRSVIAALRRCKCSVGLAVAPGVADIIRDSPEPGRCVVGLKNHGLTITGPSLDDIFERIEPVIEVQVPMIA